MDVDKTPVVDDAPVAGETTTITENPDDIAVYIRHPVTNAAYCLRGAMARTVWETEFEPNGFEIFHSSSELYDAVDGGPDGEPVDEDEEGFASGLLDEGKTQLQAQDEGDTVDNAYGADF